jgi:hypothetical protein
LHNYKRPENVPKVFTYLYKKMRLNVVFGLQIVGSCGLPEEMASIPLEFEEPVYGSNTLTFTDFMAPGRFEFS